MGDYFRSGGFPMWVMLGTFVAAVALAAIRPRAARSPLFAVATIALLIQGIFGLATGLWMIGSHVGNAPNAAQLIAQGLAEVSSDGTFCAGLATLTGIASLIFGYTSSKSVA